MSDLMQLYRISYYENDQLIQTNYALRPNSIIPFIGSRIVLDLMFVEANVTSTSTRDTNVRIEVNVDGKSINIDAYGEDIIWYDETYGMEDDD